MKPMGYKLFCAVLFCFLHHVAFARTNEFRGYWVDVFHPGILSSNEVNTLINTLRSANCNAVIAEVRARGNAYYNGSPYEPKGPGITPSSFDPLAELLSKGHDASNGKQRIEVHAWMVTYKTSGTQPSSWMHKQYNGTLSTSEYDPGHPSVQERVYNVAMDIVSRYDVDGLNFDYVRYPEMTELGPTLWGYNDVTVARFNARFGRSGLPEPTDPVWNQFRRDQVTSLVRKIYLNVMAIKPWVKISADTITWNPSPANITEWTNSARAYNDVLQDWRSWMEEGILDFSVPMNYYRHGALDYAQDYMNWMNFAKDNKYGRHTVIGPGVYLNFATNVITQFRLTRDPSPNGNFAEGVCGYSYAVPVTNGPVSNAQMFQALTQPSAHDTNPVPIFAERAEIPVMPWKTAPTKGHLKGFITGGSASNFLDGASISISGPIARSFISDATGFFGSVGLLPGSYSLLASNNGFASIATNFTVTTGAVTTVNIVLPVNAAPSIVTPPADMTVTEGSNAVFSVVATGTEPLFYQWKRNGTNLTAANAASFSIVGVTTNDAGSYSVFVTNQLGSIESPPASLTVIPPPVIVGATQLWKQNNSDQVYFTTNNHTERGLAYNPATGNLLFIGRAPTTNIYVLNGGNGSLLRTLTLTTNIAGGTFPIMMLGVAGDGAVYAANLSLNNSTPFRLYRWENDNTSSIPTVAFNGDPGNGNNQRWGDTMDVRGSGTNTQVILGSRLGNLVSILRTTNGYDFTAQPIAVSGVPNGMFGLGIAFGRTNTFWGKTTNNSLYHVTYDLTAGTGAVVRAIGNATIPNMLVPIGVSRELNLLAGITWDTPDNIRIYDIENPDSPRLVGTSPFPTDFANTFLVGSVDFGRDRVYALNGNNGILALQLNFPPAKQPVITNIASTGNERIAVWFNAERRPYTIEYSSNLLNWTYWTNAIPQDGRIEVDRSNVENARFYRLAAP